MASQGAAAAALLAGYRSVLRVHRARLPPPMRELGNQYARTEFRAWAASAATPGQWREFGDQWRRYVDMLLGVADTPEATSGDIPAEMLGSLTDGQKDQLEKLRLAVMSDVSRNDNSG